MRALTVASGLAITVALVPVGAAARSPLHYPLRASSPSDPLAAKCRGQVRQGCRAASRAVRNWKLPPFEPEPEPPPSETLAEALDAAYHGAPQLQAARYQLRASDEDYALALAELRPSSTLDVTGDYNKTVPGRTTQATRFGTKSPIITSNTLAARATLTQPLSTGGKAAADREVGLGEVSAGRAQLRVTEGDLLLQVITAYADIRRDAAALRLRAANLKQLEATLDEVKARREAGELTRTDIALAETQLDSSQNQYNVTEQQYEQDRAVYAALVGHDAGVLAEPPQLPHVPRSIDAAFALAEETNPDLAQAIASERVSRARIAVAEAAGHPTLSLSGTATLTGQGTPYHLRNEDQVFAGQAVLTIPLTAGGRVRAAVAQAQDRNSADRIGIETARRQMVETIVNAWNALSTAERNSELGVAQLASARVYDEGTFEEYRAGLRSTFDVLYAHAALRDAEIALVSARHDLFVAQAALLRHVGLLEARTLLTGTGLYDPSQAFRSTVRRDALPWDGAVRALDAMDLPPARQKGIEQPPLGPDRPRMAPATTPLPDAQPALVSPNVPVPGTVGTPAPDRSLKKP